VAPKSCQALLVQYGFVAPGLTVPLVLDVAILPQTPKLRAMEVRCPALWLSGVTAHCNSPRRGKRKRLARWCEV